MTVRSQARLISHFALCCALCGCTTVKFVELREKPVNPLTDRLTLTTFGFQGPSARTARFLAETAYPGGDDFVHMLRHCQTHASGPHRREALHATAELNYLAAEHTRQKDPQLAMELYLDAARCGWESVCLPNEKGRLVDPALPLHRETVEIYNTSLEQLLRLIRQGGHARLGGALRMPISGRMLQVEIPFPSGWISQDQLGDFDFVSNYELKNLRNRHRTEGLGVPIMVRRKRQQAGDELEQYYEDGLSLPVTVVARFPSASQFTDGNENAIRLQLLDPRETDGLLVDDTLLPLESDLSTPLAWFLTDPRKSLLETLAFLRPDRTQHLEGLYMVTPFDPDRIPVLMVHGLWSSPGTWMEMFNDLQSDPVLREKYQFWFYMYPTGEPLTFAAASLRDRLKEVRQRCDPYGQNQKLDQMVVVGHSMGGLISYLLTVDSEDKLWNSLSKLPVDQIQGDEEIRQQIRRVFFFESDRSIDRIVTIASPFNGSGYANTFTRWLGGSLISLPSRTSRLSQEIFRQNNQSVWDRVFAPRTSVDSLNKNAAVVQLVTQTTTPPDVRHHNVVGVSKGKSVSDWTDGVVKLRSASRADADSEVRVKAPHSEVHRHPTAISEVRRVLLEHLDDLGQRRYPVIPVNHSATQQATATATEQAP